VTSGIGHIPAYVRVVTRRTVAYRDLNAGQAPWGDRASGGSDWAPGIWVGRYLRGSCMSGWATARPYVRSPAVPAARPN